VRRDSQTDGEGNLVEIWRSCPFVVTLVTMKAFDSGQRAADNANKKKLSAPG